MCKITQERHTQVDEACKSHSVHTAFSFETAICMITNANDFHKSIHRHFDEMQSFSAHRTFSHPAFCRKRIGFCDWQFPVFLIVRPLSLFSQAYLLVSSLKCVKPGKSRPEVPQNVVVYLIICIKIYAFQHIHLIKSRSPQHSVPLCLFPRVRI